MLVQGNNYKKADPHDALIAATHTPAWMQYDARDARMNPPDGESVGDDSRRRRRPDAFPSDGSDEDHRRPVQRGMPAAQQVSPQGRDPVDFGDAPSATAAIVAGAAFENRAAVIAAIDLAAFEQNREFIQDQSLGGGSNFTVRCRAAFKPYLQQAGVKHKQELKPVDACCARITVGVSKGMKNKGQCTIRHANLVHSHCTATANVKAANIATNSGFLASLSSNRSATAKSLSDNLKTDHVDVSKQKIYRARTTVGRCRLFMCDCRV